MKQFLNMKQLIFNSLIMAITAMLFINVYASEFHVTTTQELQTALSTAAENNQSDSIILAAGIYKGNFRFDTEESDTSISIKAEEGLNAGNVILDGEERDRVLLIDSGSNVLNIIIENITFRNGKTSGGAGIKIYTKGEIIIQNCNIHDNYSTSNGGGLNIDAASKLSITGTIINNNITNNRGIYGSGLHLSGIDDISLVENDISYNQSLYSDGSCIIKITSTKNVLIDKNNITMNKASLNSGINISASNNILVSNNTISNNESNSFSNYNYGVIYIYAPETEFKNNKILSNKGAVYINGINLLNMESNYILNNLGSTNGVLYLISKLITARNNIITDNDTYESASAKGCLYIYSSGTINLINNTLSENKTKGYGGGLYVDINNTTTILNLYNNIIWGNKAETGGSDIYLNGYGSKKNFYNNNVHEIVGTFDFAANNIDVAPFFINTENDDFHLGAQSLCINSGTNDAPEIPGLDMDGNPRIGDNAVDIGAYEHSSIDYHPADTNKDWNLSSSEVAAYETSWKNGNSWSEGPSQIPMNYLTRAGFIQQSGGSYQNAGGAKPLCWIPVD